MATPKPGSDRIGNRRNNRLVPATDNDTAKRLKPEIASAIVGFISPDTLSVGAASVIFTATDLINTNTVTLDGKVYTFQDTLTDVDGNVHIGAAISDTLDNLIAAINLAGPGLPDYADAMTLHPTVRAVAGAGDTIDIFAKTGGVAGNSIDSTETSATASFATATLLGGLAAPADELAEYEPGDALSIAGSQAGTYVVDTVAAGVITLVEQTITNEMVGASIVLKVTNNRNLNRFAA